MTAQTDNPMTDFNTVSVILPYFNREDTLACAVRSVLDQTHRELLLYLVNDGSTDRSREVAHSFIDDRILHVDAEVNGGACAARNLGLRTATTDLIAFQDSDDEWLPEKLERQVRQLRALQDAGQRVSVLGCGWCYAGRRAGERLFAAGPFSRLDMLRGVAGTSTQMLLVDRAMAVADASFDSTFPSLEERDFVLSCLENGSLVAILPDVLAVVTRGRGDHLANPQKASLAWERYLTKYEEEFSEDDDLRSFYHFRAAREFLVAGRRSAVRVHIVEALRFRRGRRFIHLALGWVAGVKGLAVAQKVVPL